MPSATGQNWEKYQKNFADDEIEEKKITPLSEECVLMGEYLSTEMC
jgi:26S proteasome regulatory subunit T1